MKDLKIFLGVIGVLIALGTFFYFAKLYYFFYQDVIKTENSILRHQLPLLLPNAKDDYVSTWGAFGDFVGGTLNPIIGFISIILLFATWFVTYQTLKVSRKELSKSTEALEDNANTQKEIQKTQKLQQFDNLFCSLLQNFQYLNVFYSQHNEHREVSRKLFIEIESGNFNWEKQYKFINYFRSLENLLNFIQVKLKEINLENEERDQRINFYTEVVIAVIPQEILQMAAIYSLEKSKLKQLIEELGFLRNMPYQYFFDLDTDTIQDYKKNIKLIEECKKISKTAFQ